MNLLVESATEGTGLFAMVERLLKGVEVKLPSPYFFIDKGGQKRHHIRVKWWGKSGQSYKDSSFGCGKAAETFPANQFPDSSEIPCYSKDEKPVFFGHYWMTDIPKLQQENLCCVDYSAGKGGDLVCYRMKYQGKPVRLDVTRFIHSGEDK
jgi:hypothetical protein